MGFVLIFSYLFSLQNVMSEFSSQMYSSTEGRASLRQVTVALPKTWRTDTMTCSLQQPLSAVAPPIKSHISVTRNHPVFGSYPWAQQSQGCGKPGDRIKIGADKLSEVSNDTHAHTAKLLLAEWTKFRYGVFEEYGHIGDSLYPALYKDPATHKLRRNGCSDLTQPQEPFCSSKKHMPEAPTKHNALCGGRPAWDIIMQSEDFVDGK